MVTLKKGKTNFPTKIVHNKTILNNSVSIADAYNFFFKCIGQNLANKIPVQDNCSNPHMKFLEDSIQSSIYLFPVTSTKIEREIDHIKATKAVGPFSIPIPLLKILISYLAKPLENILNYSLSSGKVPDKFKIAKVILVQKKGSTTLLNNYHPISLLPVYNRILEKLMYKRLINFISRNMTFYVTLSLAFVAITLLCKLFY